MRVLAFQPTGSQQPVASGCDLCSTVSHPLTTSLPLRGTGYFWEKEKLEMITNISLYCSSRARDLR